MVVVFEKVEIVELFDLGRIVIVDPDDNGGGDSLRMGGDDRGSIGGGDEQGEQDEREQKTEDR